MQVPPGKANKLSDDVSPTSSRGARFCARLEGWPRVRALHPSFETLASQAPQRLSCESSVLPWAIVPQDGVESSEELSGDGDQSHHFWLSGGSEALIEGLKRRVMPAGDKGSHEAGRPHSATSAADHTLAAPTSRLARVGCKSCQAGDLAPAERPQLRPIGQQDASERLADAGYRGQQIFLGAPHRGAANQCIDVLIDRVQFLFEHGYMASQTLAHANVGGSFLAMAFGNHHLDDLPAPANQFGK